MVGSRSALFAQIYHQSVYIVLICDTCNIIFESDLQRFYNFDVTER